MTFEEKYNFARQELIQRKIWNDNTKPRLIMLLLKFGIKVPPHIYASFFVNLLIFGIFFGISWGMFMDLCFSLFFKMANAGAFMFLPSVYAGLMFGTFMGGIFKYGAYKLKLTPWANIAN